MAKMNVKYFSTSGSWTAPAGVTEVILIGQGGGSSGGGGAGETGSVANSGSATTPTMLTATVVPNTTYTVTIGAGGVGPAGAGAGLSKIIDTAGGFTSLGSVGFFFGALNNLGRSISSNSDITSLEGMVSKSTIFKDEGRTTSGFVTVDNDWGGPGSGYRNGNSGAPGYSGSLGGTQGARNSSGVGAAGGNASGFGAGGGGGGSGSAGGGAGGNGAPGQLWVIWVD